MKTCRIPDNTSTDKSKFSEISVLVKRVINKDLSKFEQEGVFIFPEIPKESEDLDNNRVVLREIVHTGKDVFKTYNIMGFLGYADERLIITSRFSDMGEDQQADNFLQYMLKKVFDLPNSVNLFSSGNKNEMLFELSLFLFPYYLKRALRKGDFKRYQHRMYNDGNIRGSIKIANHIKRNTVYTGKIAYSQRELSYDNELTELMRHTVEYVKGRPKICNILNRVQPEVKHIVEVTKGYNFYDRKKIIRENIIHPIAHAYYQEYVQLQQLCLSILRHTKHQFGTGNDQLVGILFDGAWLWEEYLNKLLSPYFHHPKNKSKEGKQHLFVHTAKGKDSEVGEVYPDFISRTLNIPSGKNIDDGDVRRLNHVVADAKYKSDNHIYGRDYQQVLAYMYRFEAKTGLCVYPQKNGESFLGQGVALDQLFVCRGNTYEQNSAILPRSGAQVVNLGLVIPNDGESYSEFVLQMQCNERELVQRILEFC